MTKTAKIDDRPLRLTPRQQERALRISAEHAMKMANAFGVKVPGKEAAQATISRQSLLAKALQLPAAEREALVELLRDSLDLPASSTAPKTQFRSNRPQYAFSQTSGLVDVVQASLAPLAARIDAAFVYGSVAKQEDTAQSDVDVMIISSTLGYADVFGALETATATLGRKVNPTLYTSTELTKRVKQNNAFVTRVLKQPKMWLIGSQDNLHV